MDISANVIYGMLSERYELDRLGTGKTLHNVALPLFWRAGMEVEEGRTYIVRTGELPARPTAPCLFVCVGTRPPRSWNVWGGEVFYVSDAGDDLVAVFNAVQRIFDRLSEWELGMQRLVAAGSDVRELVRVSIPIFENRITVIDFDLRILAYAELTEHDGVASVELSDRLEHVPPEKSPLIAGHFRRSMRQHEPFFVSEAGREESYCINLFLGDTYVGCCALQPDTHSLTPAELELFGLFAYYVRHLLSQRTPNAPGQLVRMEGVFDQLLHCFPVSRHDMARATELLERNLGGSLEEWRWCCIAIRSANRDKDMPSSYLVQSVEEELPHCSALLFEGALVAFCLLRADEHREGDLRDKLEAYLADMNFRAGVSRTFRDPFHARDYYLQAACALETGMEEDPLARSYLFGDYALPYMLQRACGDFEPELIVAPELIRLRDHTTSGVDYLDTLRNFLDHGCNASQTAKAMYLHRSTLVQRLEHIRRYVNLDDPERRLYLSMCLHLPDVDWDTISSDDVTDLG